MTKEQIAKLPIPELNKLCREHKVELTLPLAAKREAVLAALGKKSAKTEKPAPAKPTKAAPKKAAPVEDDDEEEEEDEEEDDEEPEEKPVPKKPSKGAAPTKPTAVPARHDDEKTLAERVKQLESRVLNLDEKLDSVFKALTELQVAKQAPVAEAKPTKAPKADAKPAPEPEPAQDIDEAVLPYLKETEDGYELDFEIEQIEEMTEESLRGILEVLGLDHADIKKGKVRLLQARLREEVQKQAAEDVALIEEIEEAQAELDKLPPVRTATKADIVFGKNCGYVTEDEEGEEQTYPAMFADPNKKAYGKGTPVPKGHARITFVDDTTQWLDAPLASLLVQDIDEDDEEEEDDEE